MLRLHQSSPSTSSSSSSSGKNLMEQKQSSALLHHRHRLYQEQTNSWHNQDTRHVDLLSAVDLSHHFPYHSIPKPEWQCNSSSLINREKRKAQFDIEENNENIVEAEEEKSEITAKTEMETSGNTCSKESSKFSEVQKPDYIHVRARRGQATDSHRFAGNLPADVSQVESLKVLNFAGSYFSGPIPPEYGSFKSLEFIHLAGNFLGGAIPPELGNLRFPTQISPAKSLNNSATSRNSNRSSSSRSNSPENSRRSSAKSPPSK
ncbi:PREDICTED: probable LRR receptor-like serine/threonine-protein kinase At4g36180 [Erythranthe guttata]|uniref:probable LRR receptor-like serine/threonine-protein kinase At4g36180 n=1 Tax=Erythranthe guttata TaxID=4155 RepID=UPI00064D7883|nr:PREDICTED: probable LRR receptor-like serine/threonine-protein kinase At4g36180 [Erythranthe guttata]|eukprot:XP_012840829.1 PREDICTED: probable LRR receptor-like serine/threonine-protein kinase At4g36180 [Erythranthe guttata]